MPGEGEGKQIDSGFVTIACSNIALKENVINEEKNITHCYTNNLTNN